MTKWGGKTFQKLETTFKNTWAEWEHSMFEKRKAGQGNRRESAGRERMARTGVTQWISHLREMRSYGSVSIQFQL